MKHHEIKTYTTSGKFLQKVVCDLCGAENKSEDWGEGYYDTDEIEVSVTVKRREGENYPSGGFCTEIDVDICPKCFQDKLIPFLKSEGAQIQEKEWDW